MTKDKKPKVILDLRKIMSDTTIKVQRDFGVDIGWRNKTRALLGVQFIRIGCWLCGMKFKEEE